MDVVLVCARGLLALVFIAAAAGKLLDPAGTREALRDFGTPNRWIAPGAWLLPSLELLTAAALLTQPFARAGAGVGLVLLVVFALGVANALRQGRAPDCHCFGQLYSAPAGRATILRNVALAAPAGLVLIAGPGDALSGVEGGGTALVAVGALAAALAVTTVVLLRENRRLRLGGGETAGPALDIGTPVPELRLQDAEGASLGLQDALSSDHSTVFVYVHPSCGPCEALVPHVERWRSALADSVELVLVSGLPSDGSAREESRTAGPHTLWDVDGVAPETYHLPGTPSAVVIDREGAIASAPVMGVEAIEALIRVARRPRRTRQSAPALTIEHHSPAR